MKVLLDGPIRVFRRKEGSVPKGTAREFEAYFLAFAQQIRTSRNDAGHLSSVDPVTEEGVHASFLMSCISVCAVALDPMLLDRFRSSMDIEQTGG